MDKLSQMVLMGAAGGRESYWLSILDKPANADQYNAGIEETQSGDILVAGFAQGMPGGSGTSELIDKYDTDGNPIFKRVILSTGGNQSRFNVFALTSTGRGFLIAQGNDIYRISSSGTIEAKYTRFRSGLQNNLFVDMAIDNANNAYVVGASRSLSGQPSDAGVWKYSTSAQNFPILFAKTLHVNFVNSRSVGAVVVDSSGNVYVLWDGFLSSNGIRVCVITKLDTNANILWSKSFRNNNNNDFYFPTSLHIDSSGNIHAFYSTLASNNVVDVRVFDPNGNLLRSRSFSNFVGGQSNAKSTSLGDENSLLAIGHGSITHFIRYNDFTLNLVWVNTLDQSTTVRALKKGAGDYFLVSGNTRAQNAQTGNAFLGKIPIDGSGQGTYGNWGYLPATIAESASLQGFETAATIQIFDQINFSEQVNNKTISNHTIPSILTPLD